MSGAKEVTQAVLADKLGCLARVIDVPCRMARENPRWGYSRVHGELGKLGYAVSRSAVRNILRRYGIQSAPYRGRQSVLWRVFLGHYRHQILDGAFRW
jgi:hypothetical protein